MILRHEHIFVELDALEEAHYLTAEPGPVIVIELMAPELDRAKAVGVTACFSATTAGGTTPRNRAAACRDPSHTPAKSSCRASGLTALARRRFGS
jgi:hypothetical protein